MSRERVIDWKKIQNIEWKNFYSASFVRIKNRILYRNISASKKRNFYYMLAFYLESKMPLEEALRLLLEDLKLPAILSIKKQIQNGRCLADVLREYDLADEFMYSCLMLGENTGDYIKSFKQIVEYLNQKEENQKFFVRVSSYPILLFVLMFALLGFIIFVLTPQIYHTIDSVGAHIPWSLQIFYRMNRFFMQNSAMIGFLALFIFGALWIYKDKVSRFVTVRFLKMSWMQSISRTFLARSILWQMEVLYGAGLSMTEVIDIVISNTKFAGTRTLLEEILLSIRQGVALHHAMDRSGLFPSAVISYVRLGEETDSLPENLHSALMFLNIKTNDIAENLKRIIQPTLVIIAGGMISLILAMVLPIINSITYLGGLS